MNKTNTDYCYCNKCGRCPGLIAQLATAKASLREIGHLCNNCRNLCDAQEIAYGKKDTSAESGCEKCWVEELQDTINKVHDKNKRLKDALQSLYDEQNGPPLIRHKDNWQAAYDKAEELLEERNHEGI